MKLAIFTDLQLDNRPPRDHIGADGVSTRFRENEATIAAAMDQAISLGAEGWVFPGDATEHKNPPSAVLAALARLFRKWRGKRIWAIPGNHDGSVYEVSSSSIEPLAVAAGEGLALHQSVTFDRDLRCLFIPYLHRHTEAEVKEKVQAALQGAGPGKIFVVMHYGPKGATVGAANTVLQSDYLSADVFDGYNVDHVFCGHIHKFQKVQHGGIQFHVIGSTLICNMGEREDRKTWCLFDTETREVVDYDIKQPRRWISIPWQQVTPSEPQWQEGDLVAITGEHPRGVFPKAIIAEAIKTGAIPAPFHITYESKVERQERVNRTSVTAEEGLREGLRKFAKEEYSRASENPGQVAPAISLAMDVIAETGGAPMFSEIVPLRISINSFTTIANLDYEFQPDVPVLVLGENGIGKSNFQAAIYWAQTGGMPKSLGLSDAVNRQADSCYVEIEYLCRRPEHADQRLRIRRSVKIDGKGSAKGVLTISILDPISGEWDSKSLNDGGEKDKQAMLNQILGGSEMVQRISNFSIQRDREAFIDVHPKVRKSVIGEISGQEPLKKAHAKINDQRLAANRALEDARQRLSGVLAVAEHAEARMAEASAAVAAGEVALSEATAASDSAAKAVPLAEQASATAAGAVTVAEGLLEAIPATEAPLAAAKQALDGYAASYAAAQAERRAEYERASETAKMAEAEIAGLAIPDPAEVARLEGVARDAGAAVDAARALRDGAFSASAQAQAHADGAMGALSSATERLSGLHEIGVPDLGALEAASAGATADFTAAQAALTEAESAQSAAREEAAGITATLTRLRTDLASLDGQDIGKCSRCGQPVDSAHIEAEQARLRAEISAGEAALGSLGLPALTAAVAAAVTARDTASSAATRAENALASGRLQAAEAKRISEERAKAAAAVDAANAAAESAKAEAARAAEEARGAARNLEAAQKAHSDAVAAHRAAADAASTAAALQERLVSARDRMADLFEAGKAAKAAHDGRLAELTAAVTAAEEAHASAEARRSAARAALADARNKASAAQEALSSARVRASEAASAVRVAESKLAAAKANEESLRDQISQVEGARLEVKMLAEQAQITSIAVDLVDQFRLGLIDNAIPFLEDRANYWLDLLGAGDMSVRFTTRDGDKDTLDVLIDDGKPGRPLDIACYSGGQCARVEMAVKRALEELRRQSVGVTLMLHAYDEPTDGLDGKGKKAFVDMVLEDRGVQIITSHDDSIISAFDHSIRLVRDGSDSTVLEK